MNSQIIQLLEEGGIKATPMRMLVLEQLLVQQRNLTLSEIEELLYPSDRITIYRTLQTFVKHGLVHSIEASGSGAIYALCHNDCKMDHHYDQHPHFVCDKCKKVICSENFIFSLECKPGSEQYTIDKIDVVLRGLCPDCR